MFSRVATISDISLKTNANIIIEFALLTDTVTTFVRNCSENWRWFKYKCPLQQQVSLIQNHVSPWLQQFFLPFLITWTQCDVHANNICIPLDISIHIIIAYEPICQISPTIYLEHISWHLNKNDILWFEYFYKKYLHYLQSITKISNSPMNFTRKHDTYIQNYFALFGIHSNERGYSI